MYSIKETNQHSQYKYLHKESNRVMNHMSMNYISKCIKSMNNH